MIWEQHPLFSVGEKAIYKERGRHVRRFFRILHFQTVAKRGIQLMHLARPDAVVISESLANKYFKGEDPIGKMIKIDSKENVMVTGVLEEIPELSSLKFDFLMSYDIWFKKNDWAKEWGNNGPNVM